MNTPFGRTAWSLLIKIPPQRGLDTFGEGHRSPFGRVANLRQKRGGANTLLCGYLEDGHQRVTGRWWADDARWRPQVRSLGPHENSGDLRILL